MAVYMQQSHSRTFHYSASHNYALNYAMPIFHEVLGERYREIMCCL